MEITLQVPEELAQELQRHQNQIVEILERGLTYVNSDQPVFYQDENNIIEFLASQPTPEQVLALKPSPELQTRVNELITHSRGQKLTASDEAELSRYLTLEHLVRLAKAHALKKQPNR